MGRRLPPNRYINWDEAPVPRPLDWAEMRNRFFDNLEDLDDEDDEEDDDE